MLKCIKFVLSSIYFLSLHFTVFASFQEERTIRGTNIKTDEMPFMESYKISVLFISGICYMNDGEILLSFERLFNAKCLLESNGMTHNSMYCSIMANLGSIYYGYYEFEKAKDCLLKWSSLRKGVDKYTSTFYNTLGLSYLKIGDLDSSQFHFLKGLSLQPSKEWKAILLSNLANVYIQLNQYDLAIENLSNSISITFKDKRLDEFTGLSYLRLAEIELLAGNYKIAYVYINNAENHFKLFKIQPPVNFYKSKYLYFEHINTYDSANYYLNLFNQKKEDLRIHDHRDSMENLEFQTLIKSKEIDISNVKNNLKITKKNYNFALLIAIVFSASLCVFAIWLLRKANLQIRQFSQRNQKVKLELETANSQIDQLELKVKLKDVHFRNINNLIRHFNDKSKIYEKSATILNMEDFITNQDGESIAELAAKSLNISDFSSFRFLHDEDWEKFKVLFNLIYPEYLNNLLAKFPDLTISDQRMACLHRLNLTSQQMADMLGISKDSLRKSNQRLRQKLNIKEQEAMIEYLFEIPV